MATPKIRLKGFEGEWKEIQSGSLFHPLKNNSLPRAELSNAGSIMNIHYGDILIKYSECVDTSKETIPFVENQEIAESLYKSCSINNGDIIFADAAEDETVGKCVEIIANEQDKIVSGLHTIACRPSMKFATGYLGYYLNSPVFHDQLLPQIQGTKISSISRKAINNSSIYYPSIKEQKAIASYFRSLDNLIQTTAKKIESLKQMKAASLISMFPQEGESTPKMRFKGFEGEWKKVKLSDLYKRSIVKNDLSFKGDKIISVANMYFLNSVVRSNDDYLRTYNIMRLGDIAFEGNRSKMYAHGRLVENTIGDGIVSHVFIVLTPLSDNYDIYFWKYYINDENIMGDILSRSTKSSTMMHDLVIDDFLNESILVPSYEEQKKLGDYFKNIDSQISLHTQRLEKLKNIKAECLNKMFV